MGVLLSGRIDVAPMVVSTSQSLIGFIGAERPRTPAMPPKLATKWSRTMTARQNWGLASFEHSLGFVDHELAL